MDPMTITYSALGALFLAGLAVIRFLWTIHTDIVKRHEQEDAKIADIYKEIKRVETAVDKRIDRNKDECRKNEKEIEEKVTELRIEIVKKTDLNALEKSIEGNVQATVDTRIAQLEAKIPQMMLDVLKSYKPS